MSFINAHILTLITFIPLVGTAIIIATPKNKELAIKVIALIATGLVLLGSVYLFFIFDFNEPGFQFSEKYKWIEAIDANYFMAVDGISLPLIIVTALLTFVCIPVSWNYERVKEYFGLLLFLEVGMIGVFMALDFILFYVFWELVLIPMYFLIGIWGGPRKEYAAIKFFLFTLAGGIFMLAAILAIFFYSGMHTFDMLKLADANLPIAVEKLAFLGFFLAFGVKVPIIPFHTWLPDAHVEAPTAISVLLAGVLLKMGTYGFLRVGLQVVTDGMRAFILLVAIIGVISIIYGALNAMVQKDLKKMVAYSSISHMGFVMLGIASMSVIGLTGAVLYMFNHGIITGMLFITVGLIYDRTHTRMIEDIKGIYISVPIIAGIWTFISFASLGLPTLSGFVSEFYVLSGSFPVYRALSSIAAVGLIITAGFFIWTIRRISFGTTDEKFKMFDATPREIFYVAPLLILILIMGIYPAMMLDIINPTVIQVVATLGGA